MKGIFLAHRASATASLKRARSHTDHTDLLLVPPYGGRNGSFPRPEARTSCLLTEGGR